MPTATTRNPSYLKKENFHNVEYAVVFLNTTTGTEMRNPSKVKIVELGANWISLRIPRTSCNKEHRLLVHILPKGDIDKIGRNSLKKHLPGAISLTTLVTEINPVTKEMNIATLVFSQFVEKEWLEFLKTWSNIQKEVDVLMKRIKE